VRPLDGPQLVPGAERPRGTVRARRTWFRDVAGVETCHPGGPTFPPPPSEPPADTCNTGDHVFESEAIHNALKDIWQQSKPTASMKDRREQGGWILSDGAGGLRFDPFPASWTRGPCSIDIPPGTVPPMNAVGWVHTHPFSRGEVLTECEWQETPFGKFPQSYNGLTSDSDDRLQSGWRAAGYNITGYMIDADKMTRFTGEGTPETETKFDRCGY
jgi:hypothetical protein